MDEGGVESPPAEEASESLIADGRTQDLAG